MLFSIQRYLEDYFERRNLADVDQYAVRLANLYVRQRYSTSDEELRKTAGSVRTAFYRRNALPNRRSFERDLLLQLNARFRKKEVNTPELGFPGGVSRERVRLQRQPKRSIRTILEEFKHATESRGVETIWESRSAGRLRPRPEKLAQNMLSYFVLGVLTNRGGQLIRELASGTGFVDVVIRLATVSHLVELKVLRGKLEGPEQLEAYMRTERRQVGWLLVFDTRAPARRTPVPASQKTQAGTINIVYVDVNPIAPSRRKSGGDARGKSLNVRPVIPRRKAVVA